MSDILFTYRCHPDSLAVFKEMGVIYKPYIGSRPAADLCCVATKNDDAYHLGNQKQLCDALTEDKPSVLIVGNNCVSKQAMRVWRGVCGDDKKLIIIRRGTETGNIDREGSSIFRIAIRNTPGINSPYVAAHMTKLMEFEKVSAPNKVVLLGVGEIGRRVAENALSSGLEVFLWSPSLVNPDSRDRKLASIGFSSNPNVHCTDTVQAALDGATHVGISIPWRVTEGYTANFIGVETLQGLREGFLISSVSNPGVFDDEALSHLDRLAAQGLCMTRIDTGVEYALKAQARFPNLIIRHDEAFADPKCQKQLDGAVLAIAGDFIRDRSF